MDWRPWSGCRSGSIALGRSKREARKDRNFGAPPVLARDFGNEAFIGVAVFDL
jgi:hypothetical protein